MQRSASLIRACNATVFVGLALALIPKASVAAVSYSDLVVKDGPVAYYRLEETLYNGASTRSTNLGTGSALHGVYKNFVLNETAQSGPQTPTWPGFDVNNQAPVFDAVNNYVEWVDSVSSPLDIAGALTLEAWVKLDAGASTSGAPGVVSKYLGTGNQRSYTLRVLDGKANFAVSDNGQWQQPLDFSGSATLAPGEWHHLAATYTPSESMKIYVNGVKVGEKTTGIPASLHSGSAPLWIGVQNQLAATRYFPGQIDEVAVYNKALDADQIAAHYNAALAPVLSPATISGLKAWYQIDDGTQLVWEGGDSTYRTSAWQDSSGNSADMLQGTVGPRPYMLQNQVGGYPALKFDGSNDWLSAGDGDVYSNTDGMTVIAVAKRDGTDRNRAITAQYKTGGSTREWAMTGAFFTVQQDPTSYNAAMNASFGAVDDEWHIYSGQWDPGTSTTAFLDGILTGTANTAAASMTDTHVALTLGAYDGGGAYQWDGMIAEVLVFNRALTPWEHNRVGWYLEQKYGLDTAFIPEPSAAILLVMGLGVMLSMRRTRR